MEALNTIPPEKKRQVYKTLRMKVLVGIEGTVAVELISGHIWGSGPNSVNAKDLCS
jgi:hypothetical protein